MKNVLKLLLIGLFPFVFTANAQQDDSNYFQLSPRVGYDFPSYNSNTPFIDYKGGLDLGLSLDYYWNWFGVGFDFDYIKNTPESTYPTEDIYNTDRTLLSDFNLTENNISRVFYGIGPNFQYRSFSRKFTAELNTRFGLASIEGGRTYLESTSPAIPLNFHSGYKDSGVFSFKGQLRFTYYLNANWGINTGAYYMRHFDTQDLVDTPLAASSLYHPLISGSLDSDGAFKKAEPCDCDISSVGVFAGLTYKFVKREKTKNYKCNITVTAKDRFSHEVLPNTDVVLKDLYEKIVETGKTNSYGVVVFNNVPQNDYILAGKFEAIDLEETAVLKDEFIDCNKDGSGMQKEILYSDLNFVLRGDVVECNTAIGIQGVEIILRNENRPGEKSVLSDVDGDFMFYLKQASGFVLRGRKDGYFSNEVSISSSDYDRNKSLFVDFHMCVNPCGQSIKLDNIIFDLGRWDILAAASQDLIYVVELMEDNPSIKVEMSSHTDARGRDDFNQVLSQKRAQSTVDYLLTKGISRERLLVRGAGESELLNRCKDGVDCTEEEHTVNRRTEFKVICSE